MQEYFVYIMSSLSKVIYVGVTNDLFRRVFEHKNGTSDGFSKQYKTTKLVYFEKFGDIRDAIYREKQIKGYRREKKVALIEKENPNWIDLANEWYK